MHISIHELLQRVLPQAQSWKVSLLNNWNSIVGNLKDHIRLEKIQNDTTLIIGVTNTAWMQEMFLLSTVLLNKINATLDQPYIKQLRFRYSPPGNKLVKKIIQCRSHTQKRVIDLTNNEKRALQRIEDQHLRQALEQFLVRCHQKESYEACICNPAHSTNKSFSSSSSHCSS